MLAGAVIVLLVVGAAYFLYSSNSSSNEIHITIRGDDKDFYDPANFTVRANQTVTLVIFNSDDNTHGLVIPALGFDSGIINGSRTVRLQLTPARVGTFPFYSPASYCTGGKGNVCNSAQDLNGTITVAP